MLDGTSETGTPTAASGAPGVAGASAGIAAAPEPRRSKTRRGASRREKRVTATAPRLADALRSELRRHAEQLQASDLTGEDVEAVHDARVAIRRIRSALRAYRPVLDAAWAAEVSAELGWLANQLDPLRDADVRRSRLEQGLRKLATSPSQPTDAGPAAMLGRVELQRSEALAAFVASQRSPRRAQVQLHLATLAGSPPISARADGPAAELVPRLLDRPWRDLRAAARAARSTPGGAELHAMRIRAKQLRYASELAASLFGPPLQRVSKASAALQTTLGEHRDASETADWLVEAASAPELAFLAGRLYAGEQRRAAAALGEVDAEWREVRRRWRRFLAGSSR